MNKLFIIGNGFDLAHGLKTSYNDFLLWYLKKVLSKLTPENNSYKDKLTNVSLENDFQYKNRFEQINAMTDFFLLVSEKIISISYTNGFIEDLILDCYSKNWVNIEYNIYKEIVKHYKTLERVR